MLDRSLSKVRVQMIKKENEESQVEEPKTEILPTTQEVPREPRRGVIEDTSRFQIKKKKIEEDNCVPEQRQNKHQVEKLSPRD